MPAFNKRVQVKMYFGYIPEGSFYSFSGALILFMISQALIHEIPFAVSFLLWFFSGFFVLYGAYLLMIRDKLLLMRSVASSKSDEQQTNKWERFTE